MRKLAQIVLYGLLALGLFVTIAAGTAPTPSSNPINVNALVASFSPTNYDSFWANFNPTNVFCPEINIGVSSYNVNSNWNNNQATAFASVTQIRGPNSYDC